MLIRPRTRGDMAELVELATTVHAVDDYPVYLPDEDLLRFLTHPTPEAAWVAEAAGRLVGHVASNSHSNQAVMDVIRAAGISDEVGVVARLLVNPGISRAGFGMQLLDQARLSIASLGRTPVLDVFASSPAVALYRRAGWRELGVATFRVSGQAISELVFAFPE